MSRAIVLSTVATISVILAIALRRSACSWTQCLNLSHRESLSPSPSML